MKSVIDRFDDKWEPVTESGCWLWTRPLRSHGYGGFSFNGKTIFAHRASWMLFKGEIPDKISVCHRCDIMSCVNPDHLFLGTHKDNMADMARKGRARSPAVNGESNGRSKLTRKQVMNIREISIDLSHREIAEIYGIGKSTVSAICSGKTWKSQNEM